MVGNAVRTLGVAVANGVLQLEDVVVLADAHEALDGIAGDLPALFGHQAQLLHFLHGLGQVAAQMAGQQLGLGRTQLALHALGEPHQYVGQLVVLHLVAGEHDAARLLHGLQHGLAPIDLLVLVAQHKHGGGSGLGQVVLQFVHLIDPPVLQFTHDHQLALGHHGVPQAGVLHGLVVHIAAIQDALVEVALVVLQGQQFDLFGDPVDEERLLAVQQVHGLELARPQIEHDLLVIVDGGGHAGGRLSFCGGGCGQVSVRRWFRLS